MRVFFRLLALAAGVIAVVAVIQAINGAPWWVAIAWAAAALGLSVAARLVPPSKTIQLALIINQGGLEKRPVADQVEQLLGRGANPNGVVGETRVLNEAAVWGDMRVLTTLLDHGADPDGRDQSGWTALHVAQNNGREDIARLLVSRGADVNSANSHGATPLHLAASRGQADVVHWLLGLGANPSARDSSGRTALAEAESNLMAWVSSPTLSQDREAISGYRDTITLLRRGA